jgi:Zn finger protein HypA/HybF involved in hydrogenase expression
MRKKTFYCEPCNHNFEKAVLEAAFTALCPKCQQWASVIEMAQTQGLTLGQSIVVAIVLYAIFG